MAEPWFSGFNKARLSEFGSLSYNARPWATVECGSRSIPNLGCSDERESALAAYTHALLWYITENPAHAAKAIQIMNAWSGTLRGGHINSNGPLQTGWAASLWPAAAEILAYSYPNWAQGDRTRFANMLKTQYLPSLINGAPRQNGNWELIITQGLISVAVFLEDKELFNRAVAFWRNRVPAYVYSTTDGQYPVPPPGGGRTSTNELIEFWYGQKMFTTGFAQETCRDLGHTMWGLAAIVNTAEIALQQGVDLYAEQATRIAAGWELHTAFYVGGKVPPFLCGGHLNMETISTGEVAYNHFHNRLGMPMHFTEQYLNERIRPSGYSHFLGWETLTHANVAKIGLPPALPPAQGK